MSRSVVGYVYSQDQNVKVFVLWKKQAAIEGSLETAPSTLSTAAQGQKQRLKSDSRMEMGLLVRSLEQLCGFDEGKGCGMSWKD